jgi:hypothetical protein
MARPVGFTMTHEIALISCFSGIDRYRSCVATSHGRVAVVTFSHGIPEPNQALNWLSTCFSALIRADELELQSQCNDNDERTRNHASPDTGLVVRLVLGAEDSATDDAANAAKANKCRRAEGAFPLPADVVGLPREDTGDVGVAGGGGEEDTKLCAGASVFEMDDLR